MMQMVDMKMEAFQITLGGLPSQTPKVTCHDPLDTAQSPKCTVVTDPNVGSGVTVSLEATDYPRVMLLDCSEKTDARPTVMRLKSDDDHASPGAVRSYLQTAYTNASQFTQVRFGEDSWWHQGWRSYLHTMRPQAMSDGAAFNGTTTSF